MEGVAPPLKCLIEMQSSLLNGESIRIGLLRYAQQDTDLFAADVRRFLFDWDQGRDWKDFLRKIKSPYRRTLLELAATALSGQSILPQIEELRQEIEAACEVEIKSRVDMLPLRMLFPLLFFLFPSYLLLLFGPLLKSFLAEVAR